MSITADDYRALDAVAIADEVAAGRVSAAELHEAATTQHEATSATINAVVEWYDEPSWGEATGPLTGVPFLRKDYGSAESGRLVERGSTLAAGVVATRTDPYYERLAAAGATVVGRTAVPEFIQHGTTESRVFGTTRNPHTPAWSAGGSSGGAAAAVAAGVVPVAHASDCAGSIRIPAATCGLVGLKPTRRRVPWPDGGWGGIAEEFVVARTARDAQRFWEVLADRPARSHESTARLLRIAISTAHWAGHEVDPTVIDSVEHVAQQCVALGHEVTPIDGIPFDYEQSMTTWHACFSRWVAADVAAVAHHTGRPIDHATLEPITLGVLDEAAQLTTDDITTAQIAQGRVSFDLTRSMGDYDLLLSPALGRSGIPLDWVHGGIESVDVYLERNDELFPYSFIANLTGRPALVVPSGRRDTNGLPQGVQLLGNPGDDELLLALAASLS